MESISNYLRELEKSNLFSGAMQVSLSGKTVVSGAYGYANYEHMIANSTKSKFRIASITKQFTAAAILLLQEKGELSIEDSLGLHFPDLPSTWLQVTIYQLLTHTSGVPDYVPVIDWGQTGKLAHSPTEILALVRNKPLDFPSGSSFNYCATGYLLFRC